jgi:hypothetical protein
MRKNWVSLVTLVAALTVTGCGSKDSETPEGVTGEAVEVKPIEESRPAQEQIPGENAVRDALVNKQYKQAVERFTAMKVAVATPEQNDAYLGLYGQIRTELEEAAPSDPKAAEALAMFRIMRNQR